VSLHAIPPGADLDKLPRLLRLHLRAPEGIVYQNGPNARPTHLEYTPDLTVDEVATLDDVLATADCPIDWSPIDRRVFLNNRTVLVAYLGLNNPTAAQTRDALKALIRVVAAIVRG
jgi:hypothetical protein